MKLLEPRRKRRVTAVPRPPFPIQIESETGIPASRALWQVYTGIFNGDCIIVDDPEEMDSVFNMGFFGKGSLSRGGPEFGKVKKGLPPYLRNRQWLRRKEWAIEQEKIERAGTSECGPKDELVDGSDVDNRAEENEKDVSESVPPKTCDEVTIFTAGPSGNNAHGSENPEKTDGSENDIITLEVSDGKSTKISSRPGSLDVNAAKAGLKEMDIVVLSDDEAPKRRAKCLDPQEEIEVIDDNSSNEAVQLDVQRATSSKDGESKKGSLKLADDKPSSSCTSPTSSKQVTSSVCADGVRHDIIEVAVPECKEIGSTQQPKKRGVESAAEVIEIVDTLMDVDDPAVVGSSSDSKNKNRDVECLVSKSSTSTDNSAEVVMVQDDSCNVSDVVMMEDTNTSCGTGVVTVQKNEKEDDSESEESTTEEQCKMIAESGLGFKVLVLPDSDSEDEGYKNYMKNLHARLEWEQFPVREMLHLSLEEAYFLSYGLGCLQVLDPFGNALSLVDLWKMFRDAQKDFVAKYIAYHYLRAKGWVVRSGLKYGGDFMLYKQGPVFYHASYVVIVEVLQAEDWSRHPTLNSRSFSWGSMTTLNRVVTAAGKELLTCQVIWPTGVPDNGPDSPASFPQFAVNEVLMRRWVPSEEREKDEESVEWDGH